MLWQIMNNCVNNLQNRPMMKQNIVSILGIILWIFPVMNIRWCYLWEVILSHPVAVYYLCTRAVFDVITYMGGLVNLEYSQFLVLCLHQSHRNSIIKCAYYSMYTYLYWEIKLLTGRWLADCVFEKKIKVRNESYNTHAYTYRTNCKPTIGLTIHVRCMVMGVWCQTE